MKRLNAITDVPGIEVGHASDFKALTGCTVVLFGEGAIGGVEGQDLRRFLVDYDRSTHPLFV